MPTSPFIDANGATYYRQVSGLGTLANPFVSDVNVVSLPTQVDSDRFLLIPNAVADISVTTSLTTILTLDVKAFKTLSLTIRNLGATNPLTGFQINGTRGTSYNQSLILATTNGDYTTLIGASTGNPHARIVECDINPRGLPPSANTSLVINVADIVSLAISATSAGTTANFEGLAILL